MRKSMAGGLAVGAALIAASFLSPAASSAVTTNINSDLVTVKVNGTDATVTVTAPKNSQCSTGIFRGDSTSVARKLDALDFADSDASDALYKELGVVTEAGPGLVVDLEFFDNLRDSPVIKGSPNTTTYPLGSQPAGRYTAGAFCVKFERTEYGAEPIPGSQNTHLKSFTIGGAPGVPGTPDAGGSGSLDTGSLGKLFG